MREKDYRIDLTETGYRVALISDDSHHTHLKSKSGAENAVEYVVSGKIPKRTGGYYLTSLMRLSTDDRYCREIERLIETRLQKGKKQGYHNKKKNK